jgi:hypothetical protein
MDYASLRSEYVRGYFFLFPFRLQGWSLRVRQGGQLHQLGGARGSEFSAGDVLTGTHQVASLSYL